MLLAILGAGKAVFTQALDIQRSLAPDDDRNSEDAGGARRFFAGCRGKGCFLTPRQNNALLGRKARANFLEAMGELSDEYDAHIIPVYVPREVSPTTATVTYALRGTMFAPAFTGQRRRGAAP